MFHPSTYGHSQLKTGHPVRSAIHKQLNGRLVLRWPSSGVKIYTKHGLNGSVLYLASAKTRDKLNIV
ncbi:hypothetical protein KCU92_g6455, partial [Aureobasidium melanogenum]